MASWSRGLSNLLYLALAVACSSGSSDTPHKGGGGSGGTGGVGFDSSSCFPGTQLCNGVCAQVDIDPQNCGACGTSCQNGKVCSLGKCSDKCSNGTSPCSASCVNLQSDPKHCGSCNFACGQASVCSGGTCVSGCGSGKTTCSGACVDLATDPQNCGACGTVCSVGNCIDSKCHCIDGVKSGDESDVDCGGSCVPCPAGKTCGAATDCQPGLNCALVCWNSPPVDKDLIGYFRMEADANDNSGKGNAGVVYGATPVAGKVGQAMQFTNGDCLGFPDSASLSIVGASALTMMAWVKTTGSCAPWDRGIIVGKEDTYELGIDCLGSNALSEAIQLSDGFWTWNGTAVVSASTWHHVAVTWDGTTVHHYVDGVEGYTRPLQGVFADRTTGLGIGCRMVAADGTIGAATAFYVGVIDEVAIYKRALSSTEIDAYYAATK